MFIRIKGEVIMKRIALLILVTAITAGLLGKSLEDYSLRLMDVEQHHEVANVLLRVSNFGFFGSGNHHPQWPSLEYPAGSGIDYLYHGALWVSAKSVRRDVQGRKLFWNQWPPTGEHDTIHEGHSDFDPTIHTVAVVDTLTSVGFDGDYSFYQLMPAYNPFESDYLGPQYGEYNIYDIVLRSITGSPAPSDDTFPLCPEGIFCFTLPSGQTGDFPGLETMTSFFYDYSPFTPLGDPRHSDRKYGSSSGHFQHFPLYLAIRQRSFTWTYQDIYDMIFFSFDIYNSNPVDTLYDVAVAMYMDCDVGPQAWDSDARSIDDVSGYYAGEGYEFAYSRDFDGDGGLSPHWVALKLFPDENYSFACWNWTRGDGPDHRRPRRIPPLPGLITSNEKYWLMTGRNPNEDKFNTLRPIDWTPGMNPHYEEAIPNDTRFLYTLYGDMQGYYEPTENSINIPPGENVSFHGVIFMGTDLEDLKEKSLIAQAFYESGYDLSHLYGVPCIPYITSVTHYNQEFTVNWFRGEGADEQYLFYKKADQPAYEWEIVFLDPAADSYIIENIDLHYIYNIKVGVLYDDVYLESETYSILACPTSIDELYLIPHSDGTRLVGNYPNPFNPDTQILFLLEHPSEIVLEIFNIRGQLVNTLINNEYYQEGVHRVTWNGKDRQNKDVAGGVYLYRLRTDRVADVGKMLLLK